jgi:hypothetical protein
MKDMAENGRVEKEGKKMGGLCFVNDILTPTV